MEDAALEIVGDVDRVADKARPKKSRAWLVFWAAVAICLSFALYTDHVWEDFHIAYRCSKNLATGHGLVYTRGQHIQAFSSPLGVLVPAGLTYLTGNSSDVLVLWLHRVVCIVAMAGAAVLLYRIAQSQRLNPLATFVLIGFFATDAKIVDFTICGQETGFMMFFLAMMLQGLMVPARGATVWMGLAWAGLMWTRFDGWIYAGILAGAFLLFNAGPDRSRGRLLKTFLGAGALAAVLYLPWLIWTWSYYGTPVPHTVIAKALTVSMDPLSLLQRSGSFLLGAMQISGCLVHPFAPGSFFFGGWPSAFLLPCGFLGWLAAWYWVLPFGHRPTRAVSFAFLLGNWYLNVVTPFPAPWYLPNVSILGIYVIGQIVQQGWDVLGLIRPGLNSEKVFHQVRYFYCGAAMVIPALMAIMLVVSSSQLRIRQRLIEEGNRKQIGLWLGEHATSPKETVFLEPLGYIGYYCQLKMLDYPGLCSPEVVAVEKKHPLATWDLAYLPLITELRPDWLVLRPKDIKVLQSSKSTLLTDDYSMVKVFDVSKQLDAYPMLPGINWLRFDQTFVIYKKR